jgi:predicted transcriptional regulator
VSVRRIKIGIRNWPERRQVLRETMQRARRGELARPDSALYFESVEDLRRILTEKRLELLLAIARHRPGSMHELAQRLGRDYKNVSGDVGLLERLGLVSLENRGGKGGARAPVVPYDEIQVTIGLRPSERPAA